MEILIGTDPELFLKKDGILQSAYGLVKGSKYNPFKVNKGAVQVDGMALEFNTDPAASSDEFVTNISEVMRQLKELVPEYEFFIEPTAHFGQQYIEEQPDEAKELGCDPDFSAYTGVENPKPDGSKGFRTGAGHVHIGWGEGFNIKDEGHFQSCIAIVKQLDFFLGLPSLLFDEDQERRSMYGEAGAFRPKSYGVEYRTLSNAWLKEEKLQRWVFNNTQDAVNRLLEGENLYELHGDLAKNIINSGDNPEKLLKELNIRSPYEC